jgi:hypothetical protein
MRNAKAPLNCSRRHESALILIQKRMRGLTSAATAFNCEVRNAKNDIKSEPADVGCYKVHPAFGSRQRAWLLQSLPEFRA